MPIGRVIAIIAGVIATVYLCWFILSGNVVEVMNADMDTGDDPSPLSSPLVAAGTAAFLFCPAVYKRLYWLRTHLRLAAQLSVVFYFMIGLLFVMGVIASLGVLSKARDPHIPSMIAIVAAAIALVVGAITIRGGKAKAPEPTI